MESKEGRGGKEIGGGEEKGWKLAILMICTTRHIRLGYGKDGHDIDMRRDGEERKADLQVLESHRNIDRL